MEACEAEAGLKLLWASSLWLLAATHSINVSQVHADHTPQLRSLIAEMQPVAKHLAVRGPAADSILDDIDEVMERLRSYSSRIPHAVPNEAMAKAEIAHRNGRILAGLIPGEQPTEEKDQRLATLMDRRRQPIHVALLESRGVRLHQGGEEGTGGQAWLCCRREDRMMVVIYVTLLVLFLAAWLVNDPICVGVAATLILGHIGRDCTQGLHRADNPERLKPWPWWTDYVALIFAAVLLFGACNVWIRNETCPYWSVPCLSRAAATPASVILIIFSVIFGITHGRQIIVRDGHYYHWLLPSLEGGHGEERDREAGDETTTGVTRTPV